VRGDKNRNFTAESAEGAEKKRGKEKEMAKILSAKERENGKKAQLRN